MKCSIILLAFVLCCQASKSLRRFPDEFLLGAATAAYQIEGAWNEDDKGENIWDRLTHTRASIIADQSNGDVAADSYHQYKRDVEMMRELNLDAYRFSFSWSRILPTGFPNKVNPAGIEYYNNLIDEMLKYNITPMATLYHWDLPQPIQELGGFINPVFVDCFADYARIIFQNFGDRVKLFITFNEPREICYEGYEDMTKAPAINASGIGPYLCAKHLVLAHAKAYHLYDDEFRSQFGGKCGITISTNNFEPAAPEFEEVAELERQAEFGIYANPIFNGDFPKLFKEQVAKKSAAQGFPRSRLPEFTEAEIKYTKGAADFFGMNHYTASYVYRNASVYDNFYPVPSMNDDVEVGTYKVGEKSASSWLYFAPKSLYNSLKYAKETYNDPDIYITENGWSTLAGLEDDMRIKYYRTHLNGVLDAIDEGVKVKGYMAWSLMDNFEWLRGYGERFGLYEVDYEDPERKRTPRKSAFVFKEIARTRTVDPDFEPKVREMSIDEGH